MKAAGKHKLTRKHLGSSVPRQNGFTRVFRQFKLDRSFGLALDHENAFPNAVVLNKVRHGQVDEITAAQLAVDGDVEQS